MTGSEANNKAGVLLKKHGWKAALLGSPFIIVLVATLLGATVTLPLGSPIHTRIEGVTHLRGVWNVPTSDGANQSQRAEVIAAARAADLDFIVTTDRNREPREDEAPADADLIVIPGVEYDATPGALVFIGEDAQIRPGLAAADPAETVSQRLRTDPPGFAVAAHPNDWKNGWDMHELAPSLRRGDRDARLVEAIPRLGVEFLSTGNQGDNEFVFPYLSAAWASWLWLFNERSALLSLYDRPEEGLKLWDDLSTASDLPSPGMCGLNMRRDTLDMDLALNLTNTYVVIEGKAPTDPEERRDAIVSALASGHSYCALDLLAPAPGLIFNAVDAEGNKSPMGSRVPFTKGVYLEVRSPEIPGVSVRLSVFKDGSLRFLKAGRRSDVSLRRPGIYRIEVDILVDKAIGNDQWLTWIYTNPITVYDPTQTKDD